MSDALPPRHWFPIRTNGVTRYAIALAVLAAALLVRWFLQPLLGHSSYYLSAAVAIAFAAWYCGPGPSIVASIAGLFGVIYLFLPPRYSWTFSESDLAVELSYLGFSAAIIVMGEAIRRMMLRLERAHEALLKTRGQLECRIRERTAELEQSNLHLRKLSARLLRVQDEERRRIARELHDSTGQNLTALKLSLASLQIEAEQFSPELARRVYESAEMARQISDDLRTISYLLHPPLLDELGLGSALRWYVEGYEKRSHIQTELDLNGNGERLAAELETAIFRVVQEALTNIHRHSGSPTARIKLDQMPGRILLEITDDGKGIAAEQLSRITSGREPSVGLRGMRERIEDFGGELEISCRGRGTQIKATIPLASSFARATQEPPKTVEETAASVAASFKLN